VYIKIVSKPNIETISETNEFLFNDIITMYLYMYIQIYNILILYTSTTYIVKVMYESVSYISMHNI